MAIWRVPELSKIRKKVQKSSKIKKIRVILCSQKFPLVICNQRGKVERRVEVFGTPRVRSTGFVDKKSSKLAISQIAQQENTSIKSPAKVPVEPGFPGTPNFG